VLLLSDVTLAYGISTIGRKGDGNEERMLAIYFDRVRNAFMHSMALNYLYACSTIAIHKPCYSALFSRALPLFFLPYLGQIGWPASLPTNEKGTFMKSVLLEKVRSFSFFM